MGKTVPITVPAIFVTGLPQDLVGGKSVNKMNIRGILDDDPDIFQEGPFLGIITLLHPPFAQRPQYVHGHHARGFLPINAGEAH